MLEMADKLVRDWYSYPPVDAAEAVTRVTSLGVLANSHVNLAWTKLMASAISQPTTETGQLV